jgi:NAD(P) transhydrogenase subunit alpha
MSQDLLYAIAIFALAILVGFEVISKVPATLHTPLMSGANSIHGIVMVGAMLIAAAADSPLSYLLAFVGMVFGAANVVGGYVVTDRMLQMFRRRQPAGAKPETDGATPPGTTSPAGATPAAGGTPPAGAAPSAGA